MSGRMGGNDSELWVLNSGATLYPMRKKMSDIINPPTSKALVFIEESLLTIDDGFFAVKAPGVMTWQNSPTVRHSQAGELSFADGHAEIWKWKALNTDQNLDAPVTVGGVNTSADLIKLQEVVAVVGGG